jgi:hypothetical protein
MKADLLDHGYVRMVSYTQPVPEEGETTFTHGMLYRPARSVCTPKR